MSNDHELSTLPHNTGLEFHFCSTNHTVFIRRRNNFEQNNLRNGSKKEKRSMVKLETRKAIGFKSLRLNCSDITQVK